VPADNKWFSRLVVGCAVVDAIAGLKLHYPIVGPTSQVTREARRASTPDERSREPRRPVDARREHRAGMKLSTGS